jgi:hypothetical protein
MRDPGPRDVFDGIEAGFDPGTPMTDVPPEILDISDNPDPGESVDSGCEDAEDSGDADAMDAEADPGSPDACSACGDGLDAEFCQSCAGDLALLDVPACLPGACDDQNPCTDDFCDAPGSCRHEDNSAPCGTAKCEDGRFFASVACSGGSCPVLEGESCDDWNECTEDRCEPAKGCIHEPVSRVCTPARCQDGVHFAEAACDQGECPAKMGVKCDDGNPCTDDGCEDAAGCTHTNNTVPCAPAACDGTTFLPAAACTGGVCPKTDGIPCDDGNPCTDDRCDTGPGCLHDPNTAPCDDKDPCTANDRCSRRMRSR